MPSHEENRRVFGRRFRTDLCNSFAATGHCKYHNRCMYAHGPEMLRTEEQNVADGLNCESAIRAWAKTHRPTGPMSAAATPVPQQQQQRRASTTSPCPIAATSAASDWSAGSPLNVSMMRASCFVHRPMSDSIDDTLSDRDIESPQSGFDGSVHHHHDVLELYTLSAKLLSLVAAEAAQAAKHSPAHAAQQPTATRWWRHNPYSLVSPIVSAVAPTGRSTA